MRARTVPLLRLAFFVALFAYLAAVGTAGQPTTHSFFDALAMRDTATVMPSLTWRIQDGRHFFPAAILGHNEGPLQFLLLNLYAWTVGDALPLNPRTMQVPGTILACLSVWLAYALGRRVHSERFGYLAALACGLTPWLAVTIRFPWIFNLLSVSLELAVLFAFIGLSAEPDRRAWRIAAPLLLALYLLVGLDWPSFLPVLALFLALVGRLGLAVKNRWNLVPLGVVLVYVAWAVSLFVYGRYFGPPEHADLWKRAMVVFPFFKVGSASPPAAGRLVQYAWETFGLILPAALAGVVIALRSRGLTAAAEPAWGALRPRLLVTMGIWLVGGLVPLLRTSNAESYGYVIAVPMALMAACFLYRLRTAIMLLVVIVAIFVQLLALPPRMFSRDRDDLRMLAAAAFLIDQRPDLLAAGKTVLLPGDEAAAVGQYARGRKTSLVMPRDFPVEMYVHSVASPEKVLRDFVESYKTRGEFKADWIVLSCEMLLECETPAGATKAVEFYRRLRADPRIRWIAVFRDQRGRALWIGEVAQGLVTGQPVPENDVKSWARRYEQKYDRYSFLKRDARYVMHE
jgi:hypothetical protein